MESSPQGGISHANKLFVPRRNVRVTIRQIVDVVEHATGQMIRGHCKVPVVCFARYIAFYLAHRVAYASFQRIANFFGMSKATVIYGNHKIKMQLASDPSLKARIVALTEILTTTAGDFNGQKGKGRGEGASRERRRDAGARA